MPRHLLDIRDLSTQELDDLMDRADDIIQKPPNGMLNACMGRSWQRFFMSSQHPHAAEF